MEKEKVAIYKKWWFWLSILLIIIAVAIACIYYLKSISKIIRNTNLSQKVTLGKLSYYVDDSWETRTEVDGDNKYEYYYPTDDSMLLVSYSKDEIYEESSDISVFSEGYISGLEIDEQDIIDRASKEVSGVDCEIIRCYIDEYETIHYMIINNDEAYVFCFGQENRINNQNIEIIKSILEKSEIEIETEEEKQERLQKEAEERAKKEKEEKERQEKEEQQKEKKFKEECKKYTYEQLARNPEKIKGKKVRVTGEVVQVLYDYGMVSLRVNITEYGTHSTYYKDTIYVTYIPEDGEDKILEDDIITIWGTSEGDYSYTSVMGSTITLPHIYAEYLEIE